jgi:hypothetical protein
MPFEDNTAFGCSWEESADTVVVVESSVRRRFRKTVKHIFKNLDIFVYSFSVGLSVTRKRFYPIVYSYLQLPITRVDTL